MEIKYLHHSEIDYKKWEACICSSMNVSVYGHAWFLDSVSKNWSAMILDDYKAVLPVFVTSDNKLTLPDFILWTGIYSHGILDKEVYKKFLTFVADNFRCVDLALDKYFQVPTLKIGCFSKHHVYEFDVIKSLKKRFSLDSALVKRLKARSIEKGFTVERVADPINVNIFLQLHTQYNFKEIDTLENIVDVCTKRRGCVMYYLKDGNGKISGLVVAVFVENYIFVPFLKIVKKFPKMMGQMIMINHLMSYFEGCPGIMVLDYEKLDISGRLLEGMGAKKFVYPRYRVNAWTKFINMFHFSKI